MRSFIARTDVGQSAACSVLQRFQTCVYFPPLTPLARALLSRLYSRFLEGQRGHVPHLENINELPERRARTVPMLRALACTPPGKGWNERRREKRRRAEGEAIVGGRVVQTRRTSPNRTWTRRSLPGLYRPNPFSLPPRFAERTKFGAHNARESEEFLWKNKSKAWN